MKARRARRESRWRARATRPFPQPVGPASRTVESIGATATISSRSRRIRSLRPAISGMIAAERSGEEGARSALFLREVIGTTTDRFPHARRRGCQDSIKIHSMVVERRRSAAARPGGALTASLAGSRRIAHTRVAPPQAPWIDPAEPR